MRRERTASIWVGALAACTALTGCAFDTTGAAGATGAVDASAPTDPDVEPDAAPVRPPGFQDPPDDAAPPIEPTAFLLRDVSLRDPHLFRAGFGGCYDITDNGTGSINAQIAASIGGDADADGFLDRGLVLVFRPFAPDAATTALELVNARCTTPADDTTCTPLTEPVVTIARTSGDADCDAPPADRLSDYSPPVEVPTAPCFASDPIEFVVDFLIPLPSADVVVSATYSPDGERLTGMLRGVISAPDAGAASLAWLLPGGTGACARHDARDVGPGGASGWYWYFNFVAERITWSAPAL